MQNQREADGAFVFVRSHHINFCQKGDPVLHLYVLICALYNFLHKIQLFCANLHLFVFFFTYLSILCKFTHLTNFITQRWRSVVGNEHMICENSP